MPSNLGELFGFYGPQQSNYPVMSGNPVGAAPTAGKLSPQKIKMLAAMAGIPPEAVQMYLEASAGGDFAAAELAGLGIENLMSQQSGGGGDGGSFQMGVDPAQAWNAEMDYKRSVDVMNAIGELVGAEVSRRGMAVDKGANLLEMYQQAVGISAPAAMKDVPGFEAGGLAEDLGKRLGISLPQGGQNAERAKIPFSALAANVNKLNTPIESDIERFRALIQSLIPEVPHVSNMTVGGSYSGGGGGMEGVDWASLMAEEPAQESGVSDSVRKAILSAGGRGSGSSGYPVKGKTTTKTPAGNVYSPSETEQYKKESNITASDSELRAAYNDWLKTTGRAMPFQAMPREYVRRWLTSRRSKEKVGKRKIEATG